MTIPAQGLKPEDLLPNKCLDKTLVHNAHTQNHDYIKAQKSEHGASDETMTGLQSLY